jgi:hypothetical protein
MATYYEAIATVEVGSGGAANIEFTSIPATYDDLVIYASARGTRTGFPADDLIIQFNAVTTGYSGKRLFGNGTGITSDTQSDIRGFISDADSTSNAFGANMFYIPNYRGSTYKTVGIEMAAETNAANAPQGLFAGLWSNTAAITSIKMFGNNGNMVQYSTFYLYGIKNS